MKKAFMTVLITFVVAFFMTGLALAESTKPIKWRA